MSSFCESGTLMGLIPSSRRKCKKRMSPQHSEMSKPTEENQEESPAFSAPDTEVQYKSLWPLLILSLCKREEWFSVPRLRILLLNYQPRVWLRETHLQGALDRCSVMSSSLWPCQLEPARLLCPWILQPRILEWVAISPSRGSSRPRDWTYVSCASCIGRQILYHRATWEAPICLWAYIKGSIAHNGQQAY